MDILFLGKSLSTVYYSFSDILESFAKAKDIQTKASTHLSIKNFN